MTYEERLILLAGPQFQAAKSARPVGFSLVVNALCPFLRMFQRRYPQGSIVPLLYPTIFPAIGIVPSVVRKRTLDAIAAVAMRGLVKHIVVTIPARSAGVTRVVRPFACAIIALALILSASIGHSILLIVAIMVAQKPWMQANSSISRHSTGWWRHKENAPSSPLVRRMGSLPDRDEWAPYSSGTQNHSSGTQNPIP
ncbi:MAG TPA: hypothetical protein VK789_24790 [Bryobacteraceae bacterium]|nr:hypothetical protein [Bryobacteraceae bacterium]